MHGSKFRLQVPVPVSLYRCIAVSLFSSSPQNLQYLCTIKYVAYYYLCSFKLILFTKLVIKLAGRGSINNA